jgi:hypothetical protein
MGFTDSGWLKVVLILQGHFFSPIKIARETADEAREKKCIS